MQKNNPKQGTEEYYSESHAQSNFEKIMKAAVEEEKRKIEKMTKAELLTYNAEIKCSLTYAWELLGDAGRTIASFHEVIKNLHDTQIQLAKAINNIVEGKPMQPIIFFDASKPAGNTTH